MPSKSIYFPTILCAVALFLCYVQLASAALCPASSYCKCWLAVPVCQGTDEPCDCSVAPPAEPTPTPTVAPGECPQGSTCKCWLDVPVCQGTDTPCSCPGLPTPEATPTVDPAPSVCPEGSYCKCWQHIPVCFGTDAPCSSSCCTGGDTWCGVNNCADLTTSATNCGSCGHVCGTANNAAPTCVASTCHFECNPSYANCNDLDHDGCEVNLANDVNHCGVCDHVCVVINGVPSCTDSQCGIASCNSGYANCDEQTDNGCETHTDSDLSHCGSCDHVCSVANGSPACSSGTCVIASCSGDYSDCNNDYADGCEVDLSSDPAHCGACDQACSVTNGTPSCSSGTCALGSCDANFKDCNGQYDDGCEVNLFTDVNNCGECNHSCAAGEICSNGDCVPDTCTPASNTFDGFTCPSGASNFCSVSSTSSDDAKAACEQCYGHTCYLSHADCAGAAWGPVEGYQCYVGYFGFEPRVSNGCLDGTGRIFRMCNSFVTFGYWANIAA